MAKTLAELLDERRVQKKERRPERSYTVCLAHDLVAQMQALEEELQMLMIARGSGDSDQDGPPRRMAEGKPAREVEIENEMAALLDQMAEYEGELRVRANRTDGEWRQWCNEHPAREGNDFDAGVAGGYCNADDLIADLGTYVLSWEGQKLEPGDFADLGVSLPDKKQIAYLVVSMYETEANLPKLRRGLSAAIATARTSQQPATSASPSDASSAGSPESSTSTSTTATA